MTYLGRGRGLRGVPLTEGVTWGCREMPGDHFGLGFVNIGGHMRYYMHLHSSLLKLSFQRKVKKKMNSNQNGAILVTFILVL